ncbi:MAG: M48 family metalloprotease [Methanobrevibacter sp.]|nr:M48 family metalloprotease [Methanobrevibacter sp.]
MAKDDRSAINPFTGKKHYDTLNDDKFLQECYQEYYQTINQSQLLDNTEYGQLISTVAIKLITAVENHLAQIGRSDYTEDYYDWEFHLIAEDTVNAYCMPGGKIVVFSGLFSIANSEEELAFILGHEMAHALLDHARTRISAQNTQNTLTSAAWFGSFALDLVGLGEIGGLARAATNVASIGSQFFLMNPWGRDQELEADKLGMMIIHWAGYDISGIPQFWQKMSSNNSNEHDFFSTHPADSKRIAVMRELIYEIENDKDFTSQPVLNETPTPKKQFRQDNPVSSNVKYCTNCGSEIPEDSCFCTNCGAKVEVERKCPSCGFGYEEGDKFCTNCGHKLKL